VAVSGLGPRGVPLSNKQRHVLRPNGLGHRVTIRRSGVLINP
jgi:hypothetical protein